MRLFNFILAVFFFLVSPAFASDEKGPAPAGRDYIGLAMHGEAKLPADFSHFAYANPDAPKGGSIRHAMIGSFDSLNPHIVKGTAAEGMNGVYGRLMARSWDEPFSLYPWIASKVTLPDDRSWMIIHLDKRARFDDGTAISVDDVLFSFETLRDKGRPNFRNVYGLVETVRVLDEGSIYFDFKAEANRETALIVAMMPIYSKAYWKDKNFDETTLTPFPSSGPYKIKTVQPGRKIIYERVKDYWASDIPSLKGQYNFDEISYDYFRDTTVAFQAFQKGQIDFQREVDATRWQSSYDFPSIQSGAVIKEAVKHERPEWVHGLIFNTRRAPFDDRMFRYGLQYAFDFEWINKTLFQRAFKRTSSIYPNAELAAPAMPDVNEMGLLEPFRSSLPEEIFTAPLDVPTTDGSGASGLRQLLKRADLILSEAGYTVKNGIRHDKAGKPIDFEILLQDSTQEKLALEFSRNLKRLGITARIRTVDSSQFMTRLNDYDYDMVVYKWHSTLSPGSEQHFYWGSAAADTPGTRNYAGIKMPAVDALAEKMASAVTRDELLYAARALDRVIMRGYYFIPLYYDGTDKIAYANYLKKTDYTPLYGAVLESWWSEKQSSSQ